MANKDIKIIIKADDQTKKGLAGAGKSIDDLAGKSQSFASTVKSHWFEITAAIGSVTGVVYMAKKAFDEFEQAAMRQEKRVAFENLARSVGQNADQIIADVRSAAGEMLSFQDTVEATGRAMLLGLDPSTITRLMGISRASSKMTGQTMEQAFSDITLGVARQSKMILDNLGLMLDYDKHLKIVQRSLGKTSDQLTDTERRQAFLNATFEAGDKMTDRLGDTTGSLSDQLKVAKAQFQDASVSLRDTILEFDNASAIYDEATQFLIGIEPFARLTAKSIKFLASEVYALGDAFLYWTNIKGFLLVWSEIGAITGDIYSTIQRTKEINKETDRMANVLAGKKIIKKLGLEFQFDFPEEFKNITFVSKKTLAAFDAMVDESLKGVDAKIKAESEAYKQLEVKTTDWLKHNINAIQEERDAFINAGVNKLLAEQIFNEKRKALTEEFVSSRFVKSEEVELAKNSARDIQETYANMYDALGFDAKGYYGFRKGLLEKQRDEEITITGDITLAWEAYYARQRELENERIRHSGSAMEGVKLFFDEEARKPQSWASEVEGGLGDIKQGLKSINYSQAIRDAESFGDAMSSIFEQMATNILDSVAKIGTNMAINALFSAVGGMLGGVAAGGAGTGTVGASYTGGAGSAVSSGGGVNYNGMTGFTANSRSGGGSTIVNYITTNHNDIRTNDVDSFRKLLRQNRGTLNEITAEGKRKSRNFEKQLK